MQSIHLWQKNQTGGKFYLGRTRTFNRHCDEEINNCPGRGFIYKNDQHPEEWETVSGN